MRILLTGVNGQVGWELRRTLAPLGEIVAPHRGQLDLADVSKVREHVAACAPDLIVNAAAYTAVDRAEAEPETAWNVNARAVGELAACNVPLVHFSTDYVFDGRKRSAYTEDDAPAPLNVYGASKLAGERAVQAAGVPHVILRTSWIYGLRGENFLRTMRRLAGERPVLRVVDDQFGAPNWSRLVAEAAALVVARWTGEPGLAAHSGVYHLSCGGRTNWHGFAAAILADLAQERGGIATLEAIPTSAYPTAAARPANSSLDCGKLAAAFDVRLPDWETALALCLEHNLRRSENQ